METDDSVRTILIPRGAEEMGGRMGSIAKYALKMQEERVSRPRDLMIDHHHGEPLAKRRNFEGVKFNLDPSNQHALTTSPKPTNGGKIPPTPRAPSRGVKQVPRYNSRSVRTTRASTFYANLIKESNDPEPSTIDPRGCLFMGSSEIAKDSIRKSQRLFFNLGQNLYIDKQSDDTGRGQEGMIRLSLWHTNAINKMQRAGARYSIKLDFDALMQIKRVADDVKVALSLCDDENFFGFVCCLGNLKFLTVEPEMCVVNLRKWYVPSHTQDESRPDLRPCREGIRMSFDQFKKFIEFLEGQMNTEFPSFSTHIFCCDREIHYVEHCYFRRDLCGTLPLQREFQRLLDD